MLAGPDTVDGHTPARLHSLIELVDGLLKCRLQLLRVFVQELSIHIIGGRFPAG